MTDDPVPPPKDDPPLWTIDPKARNEEKYFGDEDLLKGVRVENEVRWLKAYGLIVPVMMWFFAFLYLAALTSYALHFLTPYVWLSDAQLSKIQSIIFSGSVGAFVASVVLKHHSK
jgi:hypothetical protein